MNPKVLVLSRYGRLGASSRVRFYQYVPYLEAHGFSISIAPLLQNDYIVDLYAGGNRRWRSIAAAYGRRLRSLLSARRYDLVWLQNELFPWLPAWAETWLQVKGVPYVAEYDDAVFHRYDLHRNRLVRLVLGKKIDTVMRRASLVIVGNEYLGERATWAGARRVEEVPSVVDTGRYHLSQRSLNTVCTIGWIGTPVTAPYLDTVRFALAEVCKGGKARVLLVGAGIIDLNGVPVDFREWSEETEVAAIQSLDVGIMPMPDNPWERGKCGYKLIQYMACGRPVVASPVGVNNRIVEQNVSGFLASTTDDWVQALTTLRDNPELRIRMGAAGRGRVETHYSLQVTAPRLSRLLRSAAAQVR